MAEGMGHARRAVHPHQDEGRRDGAGAAFSPSTSRSLLATRQPAAAAASQLAAQCNPRLSAAVGTATAAGQALRPHSCHAAVAEVAVVAGLHLQAQLLAVLGRSLPGLAARGAHIRARVFGLTALPVSSRQVMVAVTVAEAAVVALLAVFKVDSSANALTLRLATAGILFNHHPLWVAVAVNGGLHQP